MTLSHMLPPPPPVGLSHNQRVRCHPSSWSRQGMTCTSVVHAHEQSVRPVLTFSKSRYHVVEPQAITLYPSHPCTIICRRCTTGEVGSNRTCMVWRGLLNHHPRTLPTRSVRTEASGSRSEPDHTNARLGVSPVYDPQAWFEFQQCLYATCRVSGVRACAGEWVLPAEQPDCLVTRAHGLTAWTGSCPSPNLSLAAA